MDCWVSELLLMNMVCLFHLLLTHIMCHLSFVLNRYTADILEDTKKVLLDAGMNSVMPKPEPMHAFEEALRIMARRAGNEE